MFAHMTPMQPANSVVGLKRLYLKDFRNYGDYNLDLSSQFITLTGPNGVGKTNILEAISFLSPGRGLRGAKLSQITSKDRPSHLPNPLQWSVLATLPDFPYDRTLATGFELSGMGTEKRIVKIDGEPSKSQAILAEYLSITWLTPQMNHLFIDSSSQRRKFIDQMVMAFDPEHASRLNSFEYTMRERLTLLKERRGDGIWLKNLEKKMAEVGIALVAARKLALARISEHQPQDPDYLFPQFTASMEDPFEEALKDLPALEVEEVYQQKLAESRGIDAASGRTTWGPHRSDLQVIHQEKQCSASLCSTGEQKMLLMALTLAYAKARNTLSPRPGILLLDDVVAHLDFKHRMVLFQEIQSLNHQVWMTGTDSMDFEPLIPLAQHIELN